LLLPVYNNKKLNHRKRIARQLRTKYVKGVYSNCVTFKSRLGVRQGHWKLHHSKAWVQSVSNPHSIVTMALSCIVCEI